MKKSVVSVRISTEIIERVRNAVSANTHLTVNRFFEEALTIAIDAFEQQEGGKFPERTDPLRKGIRV